MLKGVPLEEELEGGDGGVAYEVGEVLTLKLSLKSMARELGSIRCT